MRGDGRVLKVTSEGAPFSSNDVQRLRQSSQNRQINHNFERHAILWREPPSKSDMTSRVVVVYPAYGVVPMQYLEIGNVYRLLSVLAVLFAWRVPRINRCVC